jgi:hypothetical protein
LMTDVRRGARSVLSWKIIAFPITHFRLGSSKRYLASLAHECKRHSCRMSPQGFDD